MSNTTYTVTSSATIVSTKSIQRKMIDVLISLLPAAAAGVYYLKLEALWIIIASVITCVATEALWQKFTGQKISTLDLSAAVTGLLLALNLPASVPLWIPVVGGIFAIIFVKQIFGGLGQNFMNPALAARAFLLSAWTGIMSKPAAAVDAAGSASQAATEAVASASQAAAVATPIMDLVKGPWGSYIGEVSVAALLLGGAYLLIRRVITPRIPLAYIGTAFVMSWLIGGEGLMTGDPVRGLLSGALMLGAFFMATDPSTSPTTALGQYIVGIIAGILTVIFRVWGHNPEGFMYAILITNLFAPLVQKFTSSAKAKGVA